MSLKRPGSGEPFHLLLLHSLAYLSAVLLFVSCIAPPSAAAMAAIGVVAGCFLQSRLAAIRINWIGALLIGATAALLGLTVPAILTNSSTAAHLSGFSQMLTLAFGFKATLLSFSGVLALRSVTRRWPALGFIEGVVLIALVAWPLAGHRDFRWSQPRLVGDWAIVQGYDPRDILVSVGVIALVVLAILRLRDTDLRRTATSLLLLLVIAGILLWLPGKSDDNGGDSDDIAMEEKPQNPDQDKPILPPRPPQPDPKPQPNPQPDPKPGPLPDPLPPQLPETPKFDGHDFAPNPTPVAAVTLRDDAFTLFDGYYFRVNAYSLFSYNRLWESSESSFERDILQGFSSEPVRVSDWPVTDQALLAPLNSRLMIPLSPALGLSDLLNQHVPMTISLLTPLPRPLMMIAPTSYAPRVNADRKLFLKTYAVTSRLERRTWKELFRMKGGNPNWPAEVRAQYVACSSDPRYAELAANIVNAAEIKPEYQDSPVILAVVFVNWMKANCTYSLHPKTLEESQDPLEEFLFGDHRGFCAHSAQALTMMLRTRGIPARFARGYRVPADGHGDGANLLVDENHAHGWCEIYLDGAGWIPFECDYKDSEEPPAPHVDPTLQNFFGERNREENPLRERYSFNLYKTATLAVCGTLALVLMSLYSVKAWRQLAPFWGSEAQLYRLCYRRVLDRLADVGLSRQFGESREDFGHRVARLVPEFGILNEAHVHQWLSSRPVMARRDWFELQTQSLLRLATVVPRFRRFLGWLNPIGWMKAR